MWTPEREDLLLTLCEEIEDEDTSLVDRAEERSERFTEYSDSRAADAERAHQAVAAVADGIPLGQPILVGHHSERRARKDAQCIEDGMRKAVRMWDTATYWTDHAAGAIRHAKHKERPDVRARRIKGLEADKRKQERYLQEAEMWLKLWTACSEEQNSELQAAAALRLAGVCHLRLPRKAGDREDFDQNPSAYDALKGSFPNLYVPRTLDEVLAAALASFPRTIAHHGRWLAHIENRLRYERAMLAAGGGTEADRNRPERGGACRCWASPRGCWSYIQKVNRVSVTVFDTYHHGGPTFPRTIPFDKLTDLTSAAEVEAKRVAGLLLEAENRIEFFLLPEPPSPSPIQPTAEEAEPDSDPETSLRALWTAEGVSVERQDELSASVTAKAQPGAQGRHRRFHGSTALPYPVQTRCPQGRACAHRTRPIGSGAILWH